MEDNFTPELIEKARQAKSPEELAALAKENGIELSDGKAKEYFERLNKSGELADEELDGVAGGYGMPEMVSPDHSCERFGCLYCGERGGNQHYCNEQNRVLRHKCGICKFYVELTGCYIDTGHPGLSESHAFENMINKLSARADKLADKWKV